MLKHLCVLTFLSCLLMVAVAQPTGASDYLTYQGRLTDATGEPVADGSRIITFSIYNAATGGSSLWSDQFPVITSGGLFSVILGSQASLDLASLGDGDLYLEITVGTAFPPEPLTPRTLLTSSPKAAIAGKVVGDIQTSDGAILIKSEAGDSSITFSSTPEEAVITLYDPQPQRDLLAKRFELRATAGSGPSMDLFDLVGQVMGVEPSPFRDGFSIKLFDPQPEPPGKMFEVTTNYLDNQTTVLRMYAAALGGASEELVNLNAFGGGAELLLGAGTAGARSSKCISARSDAVSSKIEVVGPDGAMAAYPVIITSGDGGAKIGIGTSTPSEALHVIGNICYTGTIGACSDAAFKKDIEPIDGALDAVEHLTGVRYSWNTEQFPERRFSSDRQIGLVAQQVKEVVPEAVTQQADGYYSVDYSRLTPVLLEAIKELKKQNDYLTKRVEALEKERN